MGGFRPKHRKSPFLVVFAKIRLKGSQKGCILVFHCFYAFVLISLMGVFLPNWALWRPVLGPDRSVFGSVLGCSEGH